jgi:Mannosylglycerate hydrolase MGH1-like glycoside hydrolase domain/Glycosyl hydrolase family 63 C-terminal domain
MRARGHLKDGGGCRQGCREKSVREICSLGLIMAADSGWVTTAEAARLAAISHGVRWRRWGPYLSERQWGTVREDYSAAGDAWEYLPHDRARSCAYRWGEDGIAGFADDRLLLCLGLALWNGNDPILKERLFGLTNLEGNHGEDVKELYYYLDGTPTHSYMRMLYKYPQAAFPYAQLVAENRRRSRDQPEFELIDTGVFADHRYFDVEIEYAKADPDDILMRVTVYNRAPEAAALHVLPQIWARNIWSWKVDSMRPRLLARSDGLSIDHPLMSPMRLICEDASEFLFCENETNDRRLWGTAGSGKHFKDGINDYIVNGDRHAVNPARLGTKAAAHYLLNLPAGGSARLRLRLAGAAVEVGFADFDVILNQRRAEADEFFAALQRDIGDPEMRRVHRQAIAGMLWTKQFYYIDIPEWLDGDPLQPPPPEPRKRGRNADWRHLNNAEIISVPDKWEYPWYAAWDLAFHAVVLADVDPQYAKQQLLLLTRDWYMHPNGQLPAYEWAFGDVNPPVHAWAAWRVYEIDREQHGGRGDRPFLERVFHRLMLNFTWWVNRKDVEGRNIFQGGFLGLDNIGIFDRSAPLPTGGTINQSDGTAWMAMYTLNLMRIALELALEDRVYEDIASKFFEHFLYIADAMTNIGGAGIGLWDEADEFYYDVLRLPDGQNIPLRLRSMVGLIPLFAVEVLDDSVFARLPAFRARTRWFLEHRPQLARLVSRWHDPNGEKHLLSLLRGHRMKRLLARMLDETEFLSDYGVRSLSKFHEANPYVFEYAGNRITVKYVPGDATSGLFGGNSNWRGPVWFPVNYLFVESLQRFHSYYGDDFRVECPVGTGNFLHLGEVAGELAGRLCRLFLPDTAGCRPSRGDSAIEQSDPHFRDNLQFYEFFDGDTGRGLGAAHQTGWTGLVAPLLKMCAPRSAATAEIESRVPQAIGTG